MNYRTITLFNVYFTRGLNFIDKWNTKNHTHGRVLLDDEQSHIAQKCFEVFHAYDLELWYVANNIYSTNKER